MGSEGGWSRRRPPGQNEGVDSGGHAGLRVTRTDLGVKIAGVVDVGTWHDLSGALHRVVRRPPAERIVLDVSELSFIDAHGLRLIAEAAESLSPPTRLAILHPPPGLVRIAEILELDRRPGLVFEGGGDAA